MLSVPHAIALSGLGLDGDRYAAGKGEYSHWVGDHELSLIEAETIDLVAEAGHRLEPGETRRNIVTRGISLNDLVGRKFKLGEVVCLGTSLCHPCAYLELLTKRGGLTRLLAGRGGIRAQILTEGVICEGDEIVVL